MTRIAFLALGFAGLAACTAPAPISNVEAQRRAAALAGQGTGPGLSGGLAISTEQRPANQPIGADPERRAGIQASPSNAAPALAVGISDEQDFSAVSSRESIESDAARRAEQAAQYQVVQPGALPTRTEATGPNIVAYALRTTHLPGQKIYSRFLGSQSKMLRNCATFPSDDAAQREFLARGGPERDRLGMDPDGDGFACRWDPRPFRAAARG